MLDLRETGHEEPQFVSNAGVAAYLRRPPRDRIEIAVRFAERARLLETIGLLHGDLNPENLLVNPKTLDVQIIDFDAGVIGGDHPRTPGKPDDCMPPEVKLAGGRAQVDLKRYTREAERWSIGSLVGYCLFGAHPGFFLRSISPRVIAGYANEPRGWPEIDVRGPLFTTVARNQRAYRRMRSELHALPSAALDAFGRFFAAGLDGTRRLTAAEWVAALSSLREKPKLDDVRVDPPVVVEGGLVTVTWATRNATHVDLVPGGRRPANGSFALAVSAPLSVRVTAVNAFGRVGADAPVVRVVPLPRIERVPVPSFGDLAFSTPITLVSLPDLSCVPHNPLSP
jgi:serine/threonine protein kinase